MQKGRFANLAKLPGQGGIGAAAPRRAANDGDATPAPPEPMAGGQPLRTIEPRPPDAEAEGEAMLYLAGPPRFGAAIVDAHGLTVLDLRHDGEPGGDGARCGLAVPPGSYFLRQLEPSRAGTVPSLEQSLVLPPGWVLEVQLASHAAGLPAAVNLRMRRPGAPPAPAPDGLLAALAEGRSLPAPALQQALAGAAADPILGLLAGHLLLLERESDLARAGAAPDGLVRELRGLLGAEHPDVQALGLHCADAALRPARPLAALPVLHRSWRLLAAASHDSPGLLPRRLWERAVAQAAQPPFLAWSTDHHRRAVALRELAVATWGAVPGARRGAAIPSDRPLPRKCDPATARQRARLLDLPLSALAPLAEHYLDTAGPGVPPDSRT